MILTIRQAKNIIVNKGEEEFLFVKRKMGIKVISEFYKDNQLIVKSSLYTLFLKQNVVIEFQDLNDFVLLERSKWWYSLLYNNTNLSIKVRYFKRLAFMIFKNGEQIGTIGNPKLITFEGRYYELK